MKYDCGKAEQNLKERALSGQVGLKSRVNKVKGEKNQAFKICSDTIQSVSFLYKRYTDCKHRLFLTVTKTTY